MPVFSLFSGAIVLIALPPCTCRGGSINSCNRFHWFPNNTLQVNSCSQGRPRGFQWGQQYLKCHLDDVLCVGRVAQDSQAYHILAEVNTAIVVLWKEGRNQLAGPLVELLLIAAAKVKSRHVTQLNVIVHWAYLEKSWHWEGTAIYFCLVLNINVGSLWPFSGSVAPSVGSWAQPWWKPLYQAGSRILVVALPWPTGH